MRVVFMGTADFGVPALERMVQEGYAPLLAVTVPDKPAGRGQKLAASPVKLAAERLSLPLAQPESLKDPQFVHQLQQLAPDVIVVVAFRILPPEVYTLAARGAFNLHASLLPKYRGAAPIQRAIMNGETESGVTTFFLDRAVDTGNVILQKRTPIGEDETAGELYERLSGIGVEAVIETLRRIEAGPVTVAPQDNTLATPAPKIFKEDCQIDWSKPAVQVHNFIRGVSPRPGAFTYCGGTQFKLYRTTLAGRAGSGHPGAVRYHDGRMYVSCEDGAVEILEIQQEGRKAMSAEEFYRGSRGTVQLFT